MTDNERISKWRGECRHNWQFIQGQYAYYKCTLCKEDAINLSKMTLPQGTDYSGDPAAWTPELYQAIEDAGLVSSYLQELEFTLMAQISDGKLNKHIEWAMNTPTPNQQATALARAIEYEVSNDRA